MPPDSEKDWWGSTDNSSDWVFLDPRWVRSSSELVGSIECKRLSMFLGVLLLCYALVVGILKA